MAVRFKSASLANADGAKKLADFMAVSERWGHIRIKIDAGGVGYVSVGDSAVASAGWPLAQETVLDFSLFSDPAQELYLYNANGSTAYTVKILAL